MNTPTLTFAHVPSTDPDATTLSAEERARAARFTHEPSRRTYLTARVHLRQTLSNLSGTAPASLNLDADAEGRPFMVAPPARLRHLDFNLSHSNSLVALALFFGGRVGVDVEPLGRPLDHDLVAQRFFHPAEVAHLAQLTKPRRHARFLDLWVLKEALLKADGRGIAAGLHRVHIGFDEDVTPPRPILRALPPETRVDRPGAWHLHLQQAHGHHLAMAWTMEG